MKHFRAVYSGALVWLCVVIAFTILSYIPGIKDSWVQQAAIVALLMVFFAVFGAIVYYKNGNNDHGLKVGIILSTTALVLDALLTVPFVEIPKGGDYQSFFTNPVLWILISINITTLYVYWRLKVRLPNNGVTIQNGDQSNLS